MTPSPRPLDLIDDFRGAHAFLSNFSPSSLVWDGMAYPSAEAAFAAGKTLDPVRRQAIAAAPTPGEAKRIGRGVALRPDWDHTVRYQVMDEVLAAKFTDPHLQNQLLATERSLLLEANGHHDMHWGACRCDRHRDQVGGNMLGSALMRLRARLAATPDGQWTRVAATGHRPQIIAPSVHGWVIEELSRVAVKLRAEHGTEIAISGGAMGADLWWADAAHGAGSRVWLYQPFAEQSGRFGDDWRRHHQRVRDYATRVATLGTAYRTSLLFARNDWMLRDCHALVAVVDPEHRRGGTYDTVGKARGHVPIIHIDIRARRTTLIPPANPNVPG